MKYKLKESFEMIYIEDGIEKDIMIKQCFPKSAPSKNLSVQDLEGKELHLISNLSSLEDKDRSEIERFLKYKNFKLEVLKINSIVDEFGLRIWDVQTKQGPRSFQVEMQQWPKVHENGIVLVEDICGDIYSVNTNRQLDKTTKDLINDYIN